MDTTSANRPFTINEAWQRFVNGVSGNDIAWLIFIILLVTGIYYVAVLRNTKTTFTKNTVVWWIFAILGWLLAFFVFGKFRIFGNNDAAPVLLVATCLTTFGVSITLFKNNKVWYWIISNTVMGIVIFGMAFTFALGVQSYSYSILFGSLLGIFSARLYTSIKYLNKKVNVDTDEEESLLDDKEPTGI